MFQEPDLVNVGDLIESLEFAFGAYTGRDKAIIKIVGSRQEHESKSAGMTYYSKCDQACCDGKHKNVVDLSAYDESRGSAKFQVVHTSFEGGSGGRDAYPDGWKVQAERVDNPDEIIQFYQTGAFNHMVPQPVILKRAESVLCSNSPCDNVGRRRATGHWMCDNCDDAYELGLRVGARSGSF